ncbi:MAG TPA: hypothetical protein ENI76_10790 [Ignavibacteria bacterium]|mgnify:CR=1 FL=1|nr:hypothetical protein [Ignavibacteria bacterium]
MSKTIQLARSVMVDAFKEDPDFKSVYVANVAIILHDRLNIKIKKERDDIALAIIDLIFEYNEKYYNYGEEVVNDMRGLELDI